MFSTVYIEREIASHPRTREILKRLPRASLVECERYGEIFNVKAQNFRLQKRNPALILARKHGNHISEAPEGYGIGASHNYYFSHLLNCPYDCRYCFLQGMYRSANLVLFVDYEDFAQAIRRRTREHGAAPVHFFSGYDGDSLALESITGFVRFLLPVFADLPGAVLELRSKSTRIRPLLESTPIGNCVTAFSLTPAAVARAVEHGAPPVSARLQAMRKLQDRGWRLGLRFDPVIYTREYRRMYEELLEQVFGLLDARRVHSVTVGSFRLPKTYFQKIAGLYPDHKLMASPLIEQGGMVSYRQELQTEMADFFGNLLRRHVDPGRLFIYQDAEADAVSPLPAAEMPA